VGTCNTWNLSIITNELVYKIDRNTFLHEITSNCERIVYFDCFNIQMQRTALLDTLKHVCSWPLNHSNQQTRHLLEFIWFVTFPQLNSNYLFYFRYREFSKFISFASHWMTQTFREIREIETRNQMLTNWNNNAWFPSRLPTTNCFTCEREMKVTKTTWC